MVMQSTASFVVTKKSPTNYSLTAIAGTGQLQQVSRYENLVLEELASAIEALSHALDPEQPDPPDQEPLF